MTISLVNNQTTSTVQLYNQLATTLNQIMGPGPDGYGFPTNMSSTVTSDTKISKVNWQQIFFEANQIHRHVTGNPLSYENGPGNNNTTTTLTSGFVNTIISSVNNSLDNRFNIASPQSAVTSISDVSNPIWDSTITSVIDTDWTDTTSAQRFFNLGGKLQPNLSFKEVFPGLIEDLWIGLITEMQVIMDAHPYDRSLYILGNTQTFSTSVSTYGNHITLTYTPVSAYQITVTVSFIVGTIGAGADSAIDKGLRITHRLDTYRSTGALVAPNPCCQQVTSGFHLNGQPIIPTIKMLECNVSNLTYDMNRFDPSPPQRFTLTNTGNSEVSFYFLVFSNNGKSGGPIPTISYVDWTPVEGETKKIQPNESISMDLYYTSNSLGTYNNFVNIWADSDNGVIAIKTSQMVSGPAFRPQLATAPTIDVTNYHLVENQLVIAVNTGNALRRYTKGTCSLTWNGQDLSDHPEIFTVNDTLARGPVISFDPGGFVGFSGTTKATIIATISVNCDSVSVPGAPSRNVNTTTVTTINLDVPADQNLGSWVSPTSLNNSVVGMSYDIIGTKPYLTIGVGLSANLLNGDKQLYDPLPSQVADTNYNLNSSSLGIGADSKYNEGVPLYKIQKDSWIQGSPATGFLYDYGTWFFPDGVTPRGKLVVRRWQFNVPANGEYRWKFSADVVGYFAIDGKTLADTRTVDNPASATFGFNGTVNLKAGKHVIFIGAANIFADETVKNAFALKISNSSDQILWSTLTPVRPTEPYAGWSEVYRIPLITADTGIPGTYYSSNYVIKDTGPVNDQYLLQDFFGDYRKGSGAGGSLFVIDEDGYGNLKIHTQYKTIEAGIPEIDQTLSQLQYISYYYNTLDFDSPGGQSFSNHARRVHNLDPSPLGNGHVCRQFLGFSNNGNVVTQLSRYPGDGEFDPIPRYLVGSLNLLSTNGGEGGIQPDRSVLNLLKRIYTDPLYQTVSTIGTIVGLYNGGIAKLVSSFGSFVAENTGFTGIANFGAWIDSTFTVSGSALSTSFVGQILQSGASSLGSMFGFTGSVEAAGAAFSSAYSSALAAGGGEAAAVAAGEAAAAAALEASVASEFMLALSDPTLITLAVVVATLYGGEIWHAVTDTIESIGESIGNLFNDYGCVVATELANQGEWSEFKMLRLMSWAKRKLDSTYLGKTYHKGYQVIGPKVFLPYVRQRDTKMAKYFKWSFNEMNDFLQHKKYFRWSAPNSVFWTLTILATGLMVSKDYAYSCVVTVGPRQKPIKIS